MAGFEEQLNSILSNQSAMNQIMALARSLSGDQQQPQQPPETLPGEETDTYVPAAEEKAPDLSGLLSQIDPGMLRAGMDVLRQVQSTDDRNTALLNALRPFLKESRREKLDKAIQIARLLRVGKKFFGTLGET